MTGSSGGTPAGTRAELFTPAFITLTAAELTYFLAFGITIPTTPLFAAGSLGADEFGVGLAVGAFSIAALLLRPWAGRAADRRGRRPLLIAGAILFMVASAAHVLAADLVVLTVLRFALGVAEAFFFVAAVAALADLAPPGRAGEAVSYNSLALYLGIAFGPVIGESLIGVGGFDLAWLGAAGLAAVTTVVVWRLPETGTPTQGGSPANGGQPAPLFHRGALGPALALFSGVMAMAGFLAFVSLHARDIGLEGASTALLAFGLTVVITRMAFAKLPDRMPPLRLAATALGLTGLGLLVVSGIPEPIGLYGGSILTGLGVAFLTPAIFAFIFARVKAAERGAAMGTTSLFLDLALGGGPVLLGLVASAGGIAAAFAVAALVAMVGALGTALVASPARRLPVVSR